MLLALPLLKKGDKISRLNIIPHMVLGSYINNSIKMYINKNKIESGKVFDTLWVIPGLQVWRALLVQISMFLTNSLLTKLTNHDLTHGLCDLLNAACWLAGEM